MSKPMSKTSLKTVDFRLYYTKTPQEGSAVSETVGHLGKEELRIVETARNNLREAIQWADRVYWGLRADE